mmetsp:Transcript_11618/g.20915  ORF Transcript_11618/g.20915 Transcript_11618/m.20915 type:complete len:242 (-) Transcript_11618:39-764(-)
MDDVAGIEVVKARTLGEVPKDGNTLLTTRSAERSIGGDGDSVNVTSVASKVEKLLGLIEAPNLDHVVPTTRDNDVVGGGGEANAAHPVRVTSLSLTEGGLALTEGVPDLKGLITGTRDDLTVVGRESNGKNILGVVNEAASGLAGLQVPKTKSAIPRSGKAEHAIGRADNVLNEVAVAMEGPLGNGVVLIALLNLPNHDALIAGSRQDGLAGGILGGRDGGNPTSVARKGSPKRKSFSHFL